MIELAAAFSAGLGASMSVVAIAAPSRHNDRRPRFGRIVARWWGREQGLAEGAGFGWLDGRTFLLIQVAAGVTCGLAAAGLTELPVMALPGLFGGVSLARAGVTARGRSRQIARQDAVLDAVRMLRQLLETGAASVNQALVALAERGPAPLRGEFRLIVAKSYGRRQAWREARDRIAEPLFDMLAAAVLIQRPGGGELVPLFTDLESSVAAAQEVEREARALQAQARSASTIIVALPIAFLVVLSALRSPYLAAFREPAGELFLVVMLGIMSLGHLWMRRLLDLPGLQRVRLTDA